MSNQSQSGYPERLLSLPIVKPLRGIGESLERASIKLVKDELESWPSWRGSLEVRFTETVCTAQSKTIQKRFNEYTGLHDKHITVWTLTYRRIGDRLFQRTVSRSESTEHGTYDDYL
jgi:hypothetical protein